MVAATTKNRNSRRVKKDLLDLDLERHGVLEISRSVLCGSSASHPWRSLLLPPRRRSTGLPEGITLEFHPNTFIDYFLVSRSVFESEEVRSELDWNGSILGFFFHY